MLLWIFDMIKIQKHLLGCCNNSVKKWFHERNGDESKENGEIKLLQLRHESIFGKNIKASGEIFSLSLVNPFHAVVVRFSKASLILKQWSSFPTDIYLLKVNNGNTITMCEICLKK